MILPSKNGWLKWMRSNDARIACDERKEKAIMRQKKHEQKRHPKRNHQFEAWTHTHKQIFTLTLPPEPNMLIKSISAHWQNWEKAHTQTRWKAKKIKAILSHSSLHLYHFASHFDARRHTQTDNHRSMQIKIEIFKWNQKVFNLLEPTHEGKKMLLFVKWWRW